MHIHQLIQTYGYWGIIGALFVEFLGIPFPGETILTVSGVAWANGAFAFLPLCLSAVFGTFSGSLAAYAIGRYLGRPVILRYGKYVGITQDRLDRADVKFQTFTVPLLIFSRFLAGVRVFTPYLAGMNRTPIASFVGFSLLGSVLWVIAFLFIGRFLGNEWVHYQHVIHRFIIPLIVIASLALIALWLFKTKQKRSSTI